MAYKNPVFSNGNVSNDKVSRILKDIESLSNRELQALRDRLNARSTRGYLNINSDSNTAGPDTGLKSGSVRRMDGRVQLDRMCVKVLSRREIDVLTLVATGYSRKEIGESLEITPNTAAKHVSSIYRKLNISTIAEATRIALETGVIEPNMPNRDYA